jgi:hypothetical protein
MIDGGWYCRSLKRSGAKHSSFYTTCNVLEGMRKYIKSGRLAQKEMTEAAEALYGVNVTTTPVSFG